MVTIKKVTREGENGTYHVRYRDPDRFDTIRTPSWASRIADSVSKGAKVRMGKTSADNWFIQSILIAPEGVEDKNHAMSLAGRIRREINK